MQILLKFQPKSTWPLWSTDHRWDDATISQDRPCSPMQLCTLLNTLQYYMIVHMCTWNGNIPTLDINFSFSLAETVGWCCISSARWLSPIEGDLRASANALQVGCWCSLSHLVSMAVKQRSEFPALASSMESRESGLISSASPSLYHCKRAFHRMRWTLFKSFGPRQPTVQEWALYIN